MLDKYIYIHIYIFLQDILIFYIKVLDNYKLRASLVIVLKNNF